MKTKGSDILYRMKNKRMNRSLTIFIHFVILQISLSVSAGAAQESDLKKSPQTLCKSSLVASPAYDFRKIFRKNGLNIQSIKFYIENEDPEQLEIAVYYRGQFAGGLGITTTMNDNDEPIAIFDLIGLSPELEGKGVGSFLYLAVGQWVFNETGMVLNRSIDFSTLADETWKRLQENGFAKRKVKKIGNLKDEQFFLNKSRLEKNDFQDLVDFIRKNTRSTGVWNVTQSVRDLLEGR